MLHYHQKICWIHWWNPFLNPLTINGDICNFVTAVSALSNTSKRGVYKYARGRYFALGYSQKPYTVFGSFVYCLYHSWWIKMNIQGAAKKTALQKFQYLQNDVILLYEIFSGYWGENLLQMEQVLCNITPVCGNGATFFNALFSSESAVYSV